jgi:hypothetical protein
MGRAVVSQESLVLNTLHRLLRGVACEVPQARGYPLSHWSASDLRPEILKGGIVEGISVRQVGRFLKRSAAQAASEPLLA